MSLAAGVNVCVAVAALALRRKLGDVPHLYDPVPFESKDVDHGDVGSTLGTTQPRMHRNVAPILQRHLNIQLLAGVLGLVCLHSSPQRIRIARKVVVVVPKSVADIVAACAGTVAVVFVAAAPPALAQGSGSEKGDDAGTMMMDGGAHPKSHKGKKHKTSGKMDGGTMHHHMTDGGAMMHGGHMMDGGSMEHGGMMEDHPGMDGGM